MILFSFHPCQILTIQFVWKCLVPSEIFKKSLGELVNHGVRLTIYWKVVVSELCENYISLRFDFFNYQSDSWKENYQIQFIFLNKINMPIEIPRVTGFWEQCTQTSYWIMKSLKLFNFERTRHLSQWLSVFLELWWLALLFVFIF